MTKDRVSAICEGLDEQVDLFRRRDRVFEPFLLTRTQPMRETAPATCSTGWRRSRRRCARYSTAPRKTSPRSICCRRSTGPNCGPPTRWNASTKIGRRSGVVGISRNDAAAIRLTGALLSEQNDEWLVQRRYLSAESMTLVLAGTFGPEDSLEQLNHLKEAAALNVA
jgi:hypothetical protein